MVYPVLEQSSHRTLVVLRDRESLRLMGETRLPVLCAPAGTVLMSFDLSTVAARCSSPTPPPTSTCWRKRGMTTAFIGHGDSDKQASSNPFVKVYDELWVAGPPAPSATRGRTPWPSPAGWSRSAAPRPQPRSPEPQRGAGDRALRPDVGGLG